MDTVPRCPEVEALARLLKAGLVAATLVLAAGCSSTPDAVGPPESPPASLTSYSTGEYLPGLEADVHLPTGPRGPDPVPVVLLVPGGGWQTSDRRGLEPLAAALAGVGFVAVNSTYRVGAGVTFPIPVQDVLCASGYAVDAARAAGVDPGPVILAGHSAGGHLASLAALGTTAPTGECPYPQPTITGLIGIAGVYDARAFEYALVEFLGGPPEAVPEAWRLGDPIGLVAAGSAPAALHVLLLHGDADTVVPMGQSQSFASALERAGVPVRLHIVADATHDTIYAPDAAASAAVEWIGELQRPG